MQVINLKILFVCSAIRDGSIDLKLILKFLTMLRARVDCAFRFLLCLIHRWVIMNFLDGGIVLRGRLSTPSRRNPIFNRNPSQSSGNWAGVGFSATGTMNSADIYICKSENKETLFVSGFLLYKSMPLLNDGIEVVPDNLHVR